MDDRTLLSELILALQGIVEIAQSVEPLVPPEKREHLAMGTKKVQQVKAKLRVELV